MKIRLNIVALILLLAFNLTIRGQDTILLFHPTAYNLEVIKKLAEEDLFLLDGYHVLGVYHPGESYDYSKAADFIDLHMDLEYSLREITGDLEPGNIFRENSATAQFRELFECSQGALFMGGPDIPPVTYGEEIHLLTSVTDPFRHYVELSYLFHLLGGSQNTGWVPYLEENQSYLVNGICLGMQTMNVATGGTMVQDIPTELYGIWNAEEILSLPPDQMHRNYMDYLSSGCEDPTSYHFHRISLKANMMLSSGLDFSSDSSPLVLSSHHQALEKLGHGWKVCATSMDGKIVEGIQHKRYPNVLGVQFHPEKPGLFDPTIEHPRGCKDTINFQEAIADSDSYEFHLAFWKNLGNLLQSNRETK